MKNCSPQLSPVMRSILLVDDDRLIISNMTYQLIRAGYQVNSAGSVDKAEVWLANNPKPDLVVLDMRMPGREGLELIKRLNEPNHIPFILLTAYSEAAIVDQANALGALGYILKPADAMQLIPAIETALSRADDIKMLQDSEKKMQAVLDINRKINIAVGITMMRSNLECKDAFELLRSAARSRNRTLLSMAEEVIKDKETEIRKTQEKCK
jgi:response regulator NasT